MTAPTFVESLSAQDRFLHSWGCNAVTDSAHRCWPQLADFKRLAVREKSVYSNLTERQPLGLVGLGSTSKMMLSRAARSVIFAKSANASHTSVAMLAMKPMYDAWVPQ
jgi:hypothetical protein